MLWLGLALVLLISGLTYRSAIGYQRSADGYDHSDLVLKHLHHLQVDLLRAETAAGGFFITGQEFLLNNYRLSCESILSEARELQTLAQNNPKQTKLIVDNYRNLELRVDQLGQIVGLVRQKNFSSAAEAVRSGAGARLMQVIEAQLEEFERDERRLLSERIERSEASIRQETIMGAIGLSAVFALLLLVTNRLQGEISRLSEVEKDLLQANQKVLQRSEAKSSFLANISHEIRTPLNGILGMARLMENTPLNEEQRDCLTTVKVSSNSILALINQILDFSKIELGKMQLEEAPFEFNYLLQTTLSIVEYAATSKGLKVETVVDKDIPAFFMGDALRLRQVLLNLLNNAIKFSEKGTVRLGVTQLRARESKVTLQIEVIDEGIGLDAKSKSKLFQVFSQGDESTSRKYGGSGLGLAISKQIIEMMDGTIAVESIQGIGTRFFFDVTLKVSKFKAEPAGGDLTGMTPRSLGAHILIAEDNQINQKVVLEMTRLLGCTAKVVGDGEAVLEALREEKFDLILMDGQMPKMNGYDATRLIRKGQSGADKKHIPIVATTADAIRGDIEKCLNVGMNDYISKPICYDDLTHKIEKWLCRGSRATDPDALKRINNLGRASGSNLFDNLFQLFQQEGISGLNELRECLKGKDFPAIVKTAHILKSSSANMGTLRLCDLFERIERAKADTDPEHLGLLIDAAEQEYYYAIEELSLMTPLKPPV